MTKKSRAFAFLIPSLLSPLANISGVWATTVNLGESGWMIDFDNTKVKDVATTGFTGGDKKTGTVSLTKEFAASGEIDIKFIEIDPASADEFGLRLSSLSEKIKNTSNNMNLKMNLTGFKLELIDPNTVLKGGNPAKKMRGINRNVAGNHPGFAHFHKDTRQTFAPFTPNPNPGGNGAPQQGAKITLTGGTIGPGLSADWGGIGIHQIEEETQQRNFILRQTATLAPVPSPAALPLSLSALALIGMSLRRRT